MKQGEEYKKRERKTATCPSAYRMRAIVSVNIGISVHNWQWLTSKTKLLVLRVSSRLKIRKCQWNDCVLIIHKKITAEVDYSKSEQRRLSHETNRVSTVLAVLANQRKSTFHGIMRLQTSGSNIRHLPTAFMIEIHSERNVPWENSASKAFPTFLPFTTFKNRDREHVLG